MALGIRVGLGQHLAGAVEHLDQRARNGHAVLQRYGIGLDALGVAARVQADIADIEIGHLVFIAEPARLAHDRDINTRLLQLLDAFDRQKGHMAAVGLVVGQETSLVDAGGQAVQAVQVPVADRSLQAAVIGVAPIVGVVAVVRAGVVADTQHRTEELGHAVGLDPQELHIDLGQVDRGHRQAAILAGRQHDAAAGEIERGRHGLGVDDAVANGAQGALAVAGRHIALPLHGIGALRPHIREIHDARIVADRPGAIDLLALGARRAGLGRRRPFNGGILVVGLRQRTGVDHLDQAGQVGPAVDRLGKGERQRQGVAVLARLAVQRGKGVGAADHRLARGRLRGLRRGLRRLARRRRGNGGRRGGRLPAALAHPPACPHGRRHGDRPAQGQPGLLLHSAHRPPLLFIEADFLLRPRKARQTTRRPRPMRIRSVP